MNRDEAIDIILKSTIENLSREEREEILIDWWEIDQNDPEFKNLPEILKSEILNCDEPQKDIADKGYSALLLVALRKKYIGVRNDYLSKNVSAILNSSQVVEGIEEELYSCPCCKFKTLSTKGEYDICPVCFWEDDGSTNPSYYSSPNHMTLSQARDNFNEFGAVNKFSLQFLELDRLEKFSK
ncbi:CPCC family cysteine-rich protein [Paenibacillus sp. SGZ-1009]|uniref:CPCC family cysteine-rich protein n=1 Tax=Paenibacillus campi TaxID=3106031 RepID=UPI002AFED69C|nr:CPCC family cysteine-rich protein [Paenibacillus sp. SGZ-1009]